MKCLFSGLERNEGDKRRTDQREVNVEKARMPFSSYRRLATILTTSSREALFVPNTHDSHVELDMLERMNQVHPARSYRIIRGCIEDFQLPKEADHEREHTFL